MIHSMYKKIFFQLLGGIQKGHLEVVCPRETLSFGSPSPKMKAMLVIHDERFFARAFFGGDIGMGESFMDGDWSSPDLYTLLRMAIRNMDCLEKSALEPWALRSLAERIRHRLRSNTLTGSRRNISHHYDLGNDFYRLFLDPSMAYSCAYFHSPEDTLEQAQLNKYELICQKLNLKPNEHLLEIGTGWGGFALYAAEHYGCRITTTTISRQQFNYALELFAQHGLADDRINLKLEDYRNLRGKFDKIVSIEMFEAVGYKYYDEYFTACDRLLKPEGSMLLQTITIQESKFERYRQQSDWIRKYIFPGGELASVGEIVRSLARSTRMQLFHMEDIGIHYALTLKQWRQRFLDHREDVRQLGFDKRFLRMWEYYLASCEATFSERQTGNVQFVLTKVHNLKPLMNEPMLEPVEDDCPPSHTASRFEVPSE
jgi:cyclopropane-fatty-acyl-phospholipid synthase